MAMTMIALVAAVAMVMTMTMIALVAAVATVMTMTMTMIALVTAVMMMMTTTTDSLVGKRDQGTHPTSQLPAERPPLVPVANQGRGLEPDQHLHTEAQVGLLSMTTRYRGGPTSACSVTGPRAKTGWWVKITKRSQDSLDCRGFRRSSWTAVDDPDTRPVQNGLSQTLPDASDGFEPA